MTSIAKASAILAICVAAPALATAQTRLTLGYEAAAYSSGVKGVTADTTTDPSALGLRVAGGAALRVGLQIRTGNWFIEPGVELGSSSAEITGGALTFRTAAQLVDRYAFSLPISRSLHKFPGGAELRGNVGPELTIWKTDATTVALGGLVGMALVTPLGGSWEAEVRGTFALSQSAFAPADYAGAIIGNSKAMLRRSLGTAVRFRFP